MSIKRESARKALVNAVARNKHPVKGNQLLFLLRVRSAPSLTHSANKSTPLKARRRNLYHYYYSLREGKWALRTRHTPPQEPSLSPRPSGHRAGQATRGRGGRYGELWVQLERTQAARDHPE